jgi:hypothetical protein
VGAHEHERVLDELPVVEIAGRAQPGERAAGLGSLGHEGGRRLRHRRCAPDQEHATLEVRRVVLDDVAAPPLPGLDEEPALG